MPYITGSIALRTEPLEGGTLVAKIDIDNNGNFYTTEPVDFGSGLYASVIGGTGTQYMSPKVTTGACNSCHGVNVGKIWAN